MQPKVPTSKSDIVEPLSEPLSNWTAWLWLLLGLTVLKVSWTLSSELLQQAWDARELTLYSPLDMAYLATINWLLWQRPAGAIRRTLLVAIELGLGWWYVKQVEGLPIVVLSYGSLLLTQKLLGLAIKLPGWSKELKLMEASAVRQTVTIKEIQLITAAVAVLSFLAVKCTNGSRDVIEALITAIGFGATAALIQKAFVANRYNLLWISTALANSVAIVGIIATLRLMEKSLTEPTRQINLLGIGLENWIAGMDGLASTTVFFVVVSMPPALVAMCHVQLGIAEKRNKTLEKALAEARGEKTKEPTT